ncbi:hypothetical protein CDL12_11437 [Handroanthus impetiginosus]|uniref:DUF7734 domain-containing protein n=1 Tax=Handroanthus impetiginosus TaxID=429701 RepID=A0A2G9HF56_9LAMI|nr:hypothetical protein CDL12_11437 [Handroanthus impetiginosus]
MLKHIGNWTSNSLLIFHLPTPFACSSTLHTAAVPVSTCSGTQKTKIRRAFGLPRHARRRVTYDDEDEDEDEEFGYNKEIAFLESYTQLMKDEVLLVQAMVGEEQVEVVIFKGFSSCLSYRTSSDPSRSVLPARAVIKSIDRVKGPFDPSDIQYIEKGLTFDELKSRLRQEN